MKTQFLFVVEADGDLSANKTLSELADESNQNPFDVQFYNFDENLTTKAEIHLVMRKRLPLAQSKNDCSCRPSVCRLVAEGVLPPTVHCRKARVAAPRPECKGSWELGTACGTCPRCVQQVPAYAMKLRNELNVIMDAVSTVAGYCSDLAGKNFMDDNDRTADQWRTVSRRLRAISEGKYDA